VRSWDAVAVRRREPLERLEGDEAVAAGVVLPDGDPEV
jgi:hypothetical protein